MSTTSSTTPISPITNMFDIDNSLQDRIIRLLIFALINFIILRYLSEINLTNYEQIKIVLISVLCFMIVNTFYPYVVMK